MKFLTRLGQIVLKATEIATGFGPFVTRAIPGQTDDAIVRRVTTDLELLSGIVGHVEVIGQALSLTGTQKLTAASPLVAQVILQSSILARHEIADPVLFKQGCDKIAGGVADVLNSLKDKIETTAKA